MIRLMPFFGGLCVRISDRCVLAQSQVNQNVLTVAAPVYAEAIKRCCAPKFRTTYFANSETGRVSVHVMTDDKMGFAVVTDENMSRRTAHFVLDEVSKLFNKMFAEGPEALNPKTCDVFTKPLGDFLIKCSDPANVEDKVKKVRIAVDEVKELALDNVEKVLQRGQQIDDIVSATDELQSQAISFQGNSRALRQQLWWNNMKGNIVMVVVVVVFLFIVYLVFCGGLSCSSSASAAPAPAAP